MGKALTFLILCVSTSLGQSVNTWERIDTLTSGNFDDHNPTLDRGGLTTGGYDQPVRPRYQWLIFERTTDTDSKIVAKRFSLDDAEWDTVDFVLSSALHPTRLRHPLIATRYSFMANDSANPSLAVWQVDDSLSSHLALRCIGPGDTASPFSIALPGDSLAGSNPRVFANQESGFDLFWRNGTAFMHSRILPYSVSTSDTITVFSDSTFAFDVFSADTCWLVARTFYDREGNAGLAGGVLDKSGLAAYRESDTLSLGDSLSSPHYLMSSDPWFEGAGHFAIDFFTQGRWNTAVVRQTSEKLESVPWLSRENDGIIRNLRGWGSWDRGNMSPAGNTKKVGCLYSLNVAVWEESSGPETILVSGKSFPLGSAFPFTRLDTLKEAGASSHPDIGSVIFVVNGYYAIFSAMAWQNNSTGRNHIHVSVPLMSIDLAVTEYPSPPFSFSLSQNYPNPFNPTTRIRFMVQGSESKIRPDRGGLVVMKVYDVLGRLVKTLVNSRQAPGEHSVVFDGRGLASGVYFYRLVAGARTQVKKMILVK